METYFDTELSIFGFALSTMKEELKVPEGLEGPHSPPQKLEGGVRSAPEFPVYM